MRKNLSFRLFEIHSLPFVWFHRSLLIYHLNFYHGVKEEMEVFETKSKLAEICSNNIEVPKDYC